MFFAFFIEIKIINLLKKKNQTKNTKEKKMVFALDTAGTFVTGPEAFFGQMGVTFALIFASKIH